MLFAGSTIGALVVWLHSRASSADVVASEARVMAVEQSHASDVAQLKEQVIKLQTSFDDMRQENNRRLDALDRILARQFGQSTTTTPPPAFGPAARQQGRQ